MSSTPEYVLGSDPAEIARLDFQAASIAGATDALLRAAGIEPGMRVLDLGTGLGHVAFQLAGLVGPSGSVVGVDVATALLAVAEQRRAAAGAGNMRFVEADVRTASFEEPFDAVVCRLLLFHLPDAVNVLRHHRESLRPGGTMLAIDYDIGSARAEPAVALVTQWRPGLLRSGRAARPGPARGRGARACEADRRRWHRDGGRARTRHARAAARARARSRRRGAARADRRRRMGSALRAAIMGRPEGWQSGRMRRS